MASRNRLIVFLWINIQGSLFHFLREYAQWLAAPNSCLDCLVCGVRCTPHSFLWVCSFPFGISYRDKAKCCFLFYARLSFSLCPCDLCGHSSCPAGLQPSVGHLPDHCCDSGQCHFATASLGSLRSLWPWVDTRQIPWCCSSFRAR